MGITTISAIVSDLSGKKKIQSKFLVDTGAAYTVIPKNMAEKLGLKGTSTQEFSLADGTTVQTKLSYAIIKIAELSQHNDG